MDSLDRLDRGGHGGRKRDRAQPEHGRFCLPHRRPADLGVGRAARRHGRFGRGDALLQLLLLSAALHLHDREAGQLVRARRVSRGLGDGEPPRRRGARAGGEGGAAAHGAGDALRIEHRSLHGHEPRRRARRSGRARPETPRRASGRARSLRWQPVPAERHLVERRQARRDRRPDRRRRPAQGAAGVSLAARARRLPAAHRRRKDHRRARRARHRGIETGARISGAARGAGGGARAVHGRERPRPGPARKRRR